MESRAKGCCLNGDQSKSMSRAIVAMPIFSTMATVERGTLSVFPMQAQVSFSFLRKERRMPMAPKLINMTVAK